MLSNFENGLMPDIFYCFDDNHNILKATEAFNDINEYFTWFEKNKIIKKTLFKLNDRNIKELVISTVFLGLDHAGGMFETMIFINGKSSYFCRYSSYDEALSYHDDFFGFDKINVTRHSVLRREFNKYTSNKKPLNVLHVVLCKDKSINLFISRDGRMSPLTHTFW